MYIHIYTQGRERERERERGHKNVVESPSSSPSSLMITIITHKASTRGERERKKFEKSLFEKSTTLSAHTYLSE